MEYKKMFQEDKFYRKFGVDNRAKQSYTRFIKKLNHNFYGQTAFILANLSF